ncbi:NAD-dependent epimerase/dehydratase family protein [Parasphingopyxis algicola]|uniref:SDR family oxidoreductase n=1 Tax=Parasphingopyxis algicola TaxID=2026624 RepID=UPI0015A495B5|nr:SDR family oxidoreductase [Parasphingopyxis algicola]QLC26183.1 NAD-dependent epimerase/dehydratase family protein [Parasphingopyxis algicola]
MTCFLVTGAAGLLGGEICAALARRGHGVIGLVRKNRILMHGKGRRLPTADWTGAAPGPGEVLLVEGDVRDPQLGLERAAHARLSAQADCIIHCAAIVQFDADPDLYEAVNVRGTGHVVDFARARPGKPAALVQVSTAYVCGERDGPIAEDDARRPDRFANAYEESKFAAEALVRAAMADGVSAAIARPSIVVGRTGDGVIAGFDTIYMAFKLLAEGRIRTIPSTPGATLNFVPLDHAVNGIATIASRIGEARGRTFHLVAGAPMPVADFFALVRDYPQFSDPEPVSPDRFDPATLSPVEQRFHRRVATLYTSYFQRNPLFLQGNVENLIGAGGPPADTALMRRQIDFAIRAGFLPSESVSA